MAAVTLGIAWIGAFLLPCVGAFMEANGDERSAEAARSRIDRLRAGEVICGPAPTAAEVKANEYAGIIYEMDCTLPGLTDRAASSETSARRQRVMSAIFFVMAIAPPVALWLLIRAIARSARWGARRQRALRLSAAQRAAVSAAGAWAVVVVSVGAFMDSAYHSFGGDDLAFLLKLYAVPLVAAALIAGLIRWARKPPAPANSNPELRT